MNYYDFLDRYASVSLVRYGDVYKFIYHKFKRNNIKDFGLRNDNNTASCDCKQSNNISRAKGRVYELAMCNHWQYFCTLTLNADNIDRYNLDVAVKRFGEWVGNYNKKYDCKLKYLIIPEQHKDGAWHFHGLLDDVADSSLVVNQYGYYDLPYYAKRFGFISLSEVRCHDRCASYITKYITKDFTGSSIARHKHLFYSSRGLNGSVRIADFKLDSEVAHDLCDYENDYVGLAYFTSDNIPPVVAQHIPLNP